MKLPKRLIAIPMTLVVLTAGCVGVTPGADSILGEAAIELAGAPSATPSAIPSNGIEVTLDMQAELKVSPQSGAGLQIKLEEVEVGRANTLLVIQTASGVLLGTVLLSPGSEPLSIPLTTAVPRAGLLSASLYLDDGDRRFDANSDSLIIDESGAVMRVFFEYQLSSGGASPAPSPSSSSPNPTPSESETLEDENEKEDDSPEPEDG